MYCKPVIFLVKEKAGLLSVLYVNHIFHTVFGDLNLGIKLRTDKTLKYFHALERPNLGVGTLINAPDIHAILSQNFLQKPDDLRLQPVDSKGE